MVETAIVDEQLEGNNRSFFFAARSSFQNAVLDSTVPTDTTPLVDESDDLLLETKHPYAQGRLGSSAAFVTLQNQQIAINAITSVHFNDIAEARRMVAAIADVMDNSGNEALVVDVTKTLVASNKFLDQCMALATKVRGCREKNVKVSSSFGGVSNRCSTCESAQHSNVFDISSLSSACKAERQDKTRTLLRSVRKDVKQPSPNKNRGGGKALVTGGDGFPPLEASCLGVGEIPKNLIGNSVGNALKRAARKDVEYAYEKTMKTIRARAKKMVESTSMPKKADFTAQAGQDGVSAGETNDQSKGNDDRSGNCEDLDSFRDQLEKRRETVVNVAQRETALENMIKKQSKDKVALFLSHL